MFRFAKMFRLEKKGKHSNLKMISFEKFTVLKKV
jgi:hypothetical protein